MSSASSGTTKVSPDKRSPCTRGKTMRDFEEELSELKRENFDLKMRIYIMEEQQDLFHGVENIDEIYNINSTLKKEVEEMRKQISDKDDLILKAGDAMNLLANKHKEEISLIRVQAQQEVDSYRERMDLLQQELIDFRDKSMIYSQHSKLDDSSMMFSMPFTLPSEKKTFELSKYEETILGLNRQINELECDIKEKNRQLEDTLTTIEKLRREVISLKDMENTLRSEIVSKGGTISLLENELAEKDMDIQALKNKICAYEAKMNDKAEKDQAVQEEQLLSEELKKIQLEKEQSNYQKLKMKYDSMRQENDQLSSQIVELHKKLNELHVELQKRGAINMDVHQQLEMLKARNVELQEEARMLRVVSDGEMEDTRVHTRKLSEVTSQLQEVMEKLQYKEIELEENKNEQIKNVFMLQKLMKQNKSLTKDVENMKVLLEQKEHHHPNVEVGRGEHYKTKYEEISNRLAQVEQERDNLQIVMEQQVQKLLDALKEKEMQIDEYKSDGQHSSDKELRIEELEKQVASLKSEIDLAVLSESADTDDVWKKKLIDDLEEKNKEIEHLNEELRKRTFNLQELVNKELWDKNREIEKLNKACEKKQVEVVNLKIQMQCQENELGVLKGKVQELSDHLTQNISRIAERKEEPFSYKEKYLVEVEEKNVLIKDVENLKENLNNQLNKNEHLIKECARLKEEAEQHDKSHKELFNACSSLMTRLEELAKFLDSLLPFLGAKKRRMLQQVIDRSREASRNLSISFFDQTILSNTSNISAVPILPDFSQVDFCSEDDTLDITLVTKEGIEDQNAEVVQIREQVESLVEKLKETRLSPEKKKETKCPSVWSLKAHSLDKSFDMSRIGVEVALEDITEGSVLESFESDNQSDSRQNLTAKSDQRNCNNLGSTVVGSDVIPEKSLLCSESEGWSEPDRNVSMARIGIKEEVNAAVPSSDESSDCMPKPCLPPSTKKRHEEVRRLNMKIKHLEKLNSSLLSELRLREKLVDPVHLSSSTDVHIHGLVTKTLLDEVKKQREKLQASLAHNEFIRNQLEGVLTSSIGEMEGKKNLVSQLREMSVELEKSCSLCLELERRCIALESERSSLREAAEKLRAEAATLRANLKEKENEALEAQCSLLDLRNKHLMLESTANTAESRAEEATARALLLEGRIAEIDGTLREAQEGWSKAAAAWEQEKQILKETHSKEVSDLRAATTRMKSEFEKSSYEQRLSVERVHKKLEEILLKRNLADSEWKQRLDALEREKKQELNDEIEKRMDLERKLVVSYEKQSDLRSRLEIEMSKTREIETSHKEVKTELERRVAELEAANKEMENKLCSLHTQQSSDSELQFPSSPSPKSPRFLLNRQRSNPTSDYTSDPDHHGSNGNLWFPVCGRSNNNSSPDLGIESDQGRLSSLDAIPPASPKTIFLEKIRKLELENNELHGQLQRTRKALEEALAQLSVANKKKRQVERAICQQLSKTHYILQQARTNLESSDHST